MLAVGIVVGIVAIAGGAKTPFGGGSGLATPKFAFRVTKVLAVPTGTDAKAAQLKERARTPANEVARTMDALYTQAFLNPDNWQNGSYDAVWAMFEPGAAAEARRQADTVTAGTAAGVAFNGIQPKTGTLKAKVLLDPKDQPFSVVAMVRFVAVGSGKDGRDVVMTSQGQFVFQKRSGAWKVVSFKILRNNVAKAAPSPSAPASGSSS